MHREPTADLKAVYYRGRYWATTSWSKVGKGSGAGDAPETEALSGGKAAEKARRKAGPTLETAM